MNKTVTINISGLIFNIDEIAYAKLKNYLATIEGYFKSSEGGDEIMTDIEGRIAEMFSDRISDRKEVISMLDVDAMIATMGQPEDFIDEETKEENTRKNQEKETEENQREQHHEHDNKNENYDRGARRFYRDPDSRIVGGVCSGIGYYFGIDPIIIRLLFVITFFTLGGSLFVYIIFWIITPKANTRAEKLQMKGRKVNIENIKQTVKEEANEVKKNFKNFEGRVDNFAHGEGGKRVSNFIQTFFGFIASILKNILHFFGRFFGLILILFSGFWMLFLLFSLVGIHVWDGPLTINGGASFLSAADLNTLIFTSSWTGYFFSIGLGLFFGIPLLLLFVIGFKILFGIRRTTKYLGLGFGGAWLFGIVLLVIGSASIAGDFSNEDKTTRSMALSPTFADTVNVSVNLSSVPRGVRMTDPNGFFNILKIDKKAKYFSNVSLNVIQNNSDSIVITVKQKSRGSSYKDAMYKVEQIQYSYSIEGQEIIFDPYFSIPLAEQYRFQEVELTISIPVGKTIYLGKGSAWIIYDIDNLTNTRDRQMIGKYWTMTENGLQCLHCRFIGGNDYGNGNSPDLNSMSLQELENELFELKGEIKLKKLKYEDKLNRKKAEYKSQIALYNKKIENATNDESIKNYEIQVEELVTKMNIATGKITRRMEEELKELEMQYQNIKSAIRTNYPEESTEETGKRNDIDADASTSSVFTRLSFPSPFRIIS